MNKLPLNQIIHGDCIEVLQGFPENSIDLVVTDPPYGLNFMGKEWDKALPPKEAFKEIHRVLKPGAIAFVMSSPRQDLLWRMCALLEESGFELSQSFISWIYKTGFPKAYDVSKGIDKKQGKERKKIGEGKSGKPESHNTHNIRRDLDNGGYEFGGEFDITVPSSDDAKTWNGWKAQTGLKPALEPILMVNKPFTEKTIVGNVLRWGTGAINIDACRIPFKGKPDKDAYDFNKDGSLRGDIGRNGPHPMGSNIVEITDQKGRFPANLIVSDDALNDGELTKTGTIDPHHVIKGDGEGHQANKVYGKYGLMPSEKHITYGDEGSKSRFFDLDAWAEHHGFLDVAKPDPSERDFGLKGKKKDSNKFQRGIGEQRRQAGIGFSRNTHPTVKPIKLMAYLIELGCPKNGVVLDPFLGSGTTCIASKRLCRKYIGIELNEEYHLLAQSRVAAYPDPLEWFSEPSINKQTKRIPK